MLFLVLSTCRSGWPAVREGDGGDGGDGGDRGDGDDRSEGECECDL